MPEPRDLLVGLPATAGRPILTGPEITARRLDAAIRRIPANLSQCFYGSRDTRSSFPDPVEHGAEAIGKKVIHHLDGHSVPMRRILGDSERRIGEGSWRGDAVGVAVALEIAGERRPATTRILYGVVATF